MMEVVRGNTVRREDNPKVIDFSVRNGGKSDNGPKYRKDGVLKQTVNNSSIDRFVEPIREKADVARVASYLLERAKEAKSPNKKNAAYRDWLLYVVGVNVGLRVSDLTKLTWDHILNPDMKTFRQYDPHNKKEKKTDKLKTIYINDAMKDAFALYLSKTGVVPKSGEEEYIFTVNYKRKDGKCHTISTAAVEKMVKRATKACSLKGNYNTHSLRKTYAYHKFMQYQAEGDPLALEKVQYDLNHYNSRDTLRYLGITRNEKIESSKRLSNYWGENLFGAIEDETE